MTLNNNTYFIFIVSESIIGSQSCRCISCSHTFPWRRWTWHLTPSLSSKLDPFPPCNWNICEWTLFKKYIFIEPFFFIQVRTHYLQDKSWHTVWKSNKRRECIPLLSVYIFILYFIVFMLRKRVIVDKLALWCLLIASVMFLLFYLIGIWVITRSASSSLAALKTSPAPCWCWS